MAERVQTVADYYDARVEDEWRRLDESWIEFAVTLHFIRNLVPDGGRILDLGGGPGRYALELAAAGHAVDLIDLSSGNVTRARAEAKNRGVALGLTEVGDARDLSRIAPDVYDAVLNLGPLYHLVVRAERLQCIAETARILKPGGVGFFAHLSSYAPAHFAVKEPGRLQAMKPLLDQVTGQESFTLGSETGFFTGAVFMHPDRVSEEFEDSEFEREVMFGAESLFAQSEAALRHRPPLERRDISELAIHHAADRAATFTSEHIVFVGRRRPALHCDHASREDPA